LERLLAREADELRRHVLRQLALSARTLGIVVEVVAELRSDRDIAALFQDRREDRLAAPVAVRISRVDVVDAEVERLADEVLRLRVGVVAPPPGRHGPRAEAELGDLNVSAV